MKIINFGILMLLIMISACTSLSQKTQKSATQASRGMQSESLNLEAYEKASRLTKGWPEASVNAAKEMVAKYGDPQEITSDSLIWRNVAPFKKIIVHKEVYSHRFPLLHQNSLQHVVDYRGMESKINDIWKYNGSVTLDRTKGEMSSFAENEAMNILALNFAHRIMTGKLTSETARIKFGKETMDYLNGNKLASTSVLEFGNQFQTQDPGETVTTKIRWIGDPDAPKTPKVQRQAQEER